MRRRLMDWLLVAAWLCLLALALGLMLWLAGPVRGAPVPFARPVPAAPSLAGSWWAQRPGSTWVYELHLLRDGFSAERVHYPDGSLGSWWLGTWRVDGDRLVLDETHWITGGEVTRCRSGESFPLSCLRRER